MLDEMGDVFAEEGERRIGDYDVRLLQKLDTLTGAKVPVSLQGEYIQAIAMRVSVPPPPPWNSIPTAVSSFPLENRSICRFL